MSSEGDSGSMALPPVRAVAFLNLILSLCLDQRGYLCLVAKPGDHLSFPGIPRKWNNRRQIAGQGRMIYTEVELSVLLDVLIPHWSSMVTPVISALLIKFWDDVYQLASAGPLPAWSLRAGTILFHCCISYIWHTMHSSYTFVEKRGEDLC